jgi:hypothetical protein
MKTWTSDEIKEKLLSSDKWIISGLMAIYRRQTDDEQSNGKTAHDNGIGFNSVDSEIMSSFAKWHKKNGYLSNKQIAIARKKIIKYNKQLTQIANQNEVWKASKAAMMKG